MTAHPRMLQKGRFSHAISPGTPPDEKKAERFRALALPHLDDVYTLARYLLRDPSDAEDAAQECYLRALRHFDTFRGGPIKPWLLAILRNVCRAEYARRGRAAAPLDDARDRRAKPIGNAVERDAGSPEATSLVRLDAETARRLIAQLPEQFREVLVLREIED